MLLYFFVFIVIMLLICYLIFYLNLITQFLSVILVILAILVIIVLKSLMHIHYYDNFLSFQASIIFFIDHLHVHYKPHYQTIHACKHIVYLNYIFLVNNLYTFQLYIDSSFWDPYFHGIIGMRILSYIYLFDKVNKVEFFYGRVFSINSLYEHKCM